MKNIANYITVSRMIMSILLFVTETFSIAFHIIYIYYRKFFNEMGLTDEQIIPIKADATDLKYEKEFFDAVISTDSYNYFGRDENFLDENLLPFVKKGG